MKKSKANRKEKQDTDRAGRRPSPAGKRLRTFGSLILLILVAFGAYFLLYARSRMDLVNRHHLRLISSTGQYASDAIEGAYVNGKKALDSDQSEKISEYIKLIPGFVEADVPKINGELAIDSGTGLPHLIIVSKKGNRAGKVALGRLLRPTLPLEFFDKVVVARSDGDVLMQGGADPISFQNLGLITEEGTVLDGQGSERGMITPKDVPASEILDVTVSGASYKAFLMPFPLPIPIYSLESDEPVESDSYWFVVGLLSSGKYRAMSMAFPPTVIVMAISLLLLGLLSLPFLRIVFMGVREELRHIDIVAMTLATIVGTSLSTFGILYFSTQFMLGERTKDELEHLSDSISTRLTEELDNLDSVLEQLTEFMLEQEGTTGVGLLSGEKGSRWSEYPFFEMAILMDPNGEQKKKWTIRGTTTPVYRYPDRAYFRQALDGLLWNGSDESSRFIAGRYVESIRSKTTGQEYAMLSRRAHGEDLPVAVVESRLLSVISPVLPPGTGFAVVDDSGLVQFHSDPVRNIRENIFEELGNSDPVQLAVRERQEDCCAWTTYRTVDSVIRWAPIEDTPWSLLVFKDATASRQWLVEVSTLSLLVYALYVSILVMLGLLAYSHRRDHPRAGEPRELWYWPREDYRSTYIGLIVCLALVCLLMISVLIQGRRVSQDLLMAISFLIPLGSYGLCQVALRSRARSRGERWKFTWARDLPLLKNMKIRTVYFLLMTVVATVIGVLPVLGFFRVVVTQKEILREADRQVSFARSLQARRLDKLRWYEDASIGDGLEAIRNNIRGDDGGKRTLGFYSPEDWSWKFRDSGDDEEGSENCTSPPRNFILSAFDNLGLMDSDRPKRSWSVCDDDTLELSTLGWPIPMGYVGTPPHSGRPSVDVLTIRSPLGQSISTETLRSGTFWILGFIGLVSLGWIVKQAVRCVFLGDYVLPRTLNGKDILEKQLVTGAEGPIKNAILLRFGLTPECLKDFHEIDVGDLRSVSRVEELIEIWRKSRKPKLLLKHFDYGLQEPAVIEKKLRLIECLNETDRGPSQILIQSSVDPLYILTARLQDRYDRRASLGISLERWSAALQPYARLRTSPYHESGPFTEKVASALKGKDVDPDVQETLIEEGLPNLPLKQQALYLASSEKIREFKPGDVVGNMLDLGRALYRRIWTSCSTEEKVLLYRIAKEGFVNRKASEVLRPLQRRGLVFRDPNCRIMNESFRRFIMTAELPEVFWKWEQRGVESAWARMRTPLIFALVIFAVFFFATQREAFHRTMAIFAALTAGAPALIRLIALTLRREES